jgi:hypothetical protein
MSHLTDKDVEAITGLLRSLSLLPQEDKNTKPGEGTKSAIEDFSLDITKQTNSLIKWATGAGAGVPIVAAVWGYLQNQGPIVLSALLVAAAVVIAAGAYALARVADGDIRGRSAAATAAIEARGAVARTLIEVYGKSGEGSSADRGDADTKSQTGPTESQLLQILAAFDSAKVVTDAGEFSVSDARWLSKDRQVELRLAGGDWVTLSEIRRIVK